MSRKRNQSERGSSTIYFTIIAAAFISAFSLVMVALSHMEKTNEALRQANLASNMVLSYYDNRLESSYGLLAYRKNSQVDQRAFEPYFGKDYKIESVGTLSQLSEFQNQAVALGQLAIAAEAFQGLKKQADQMTELEKNQKDLKEKNKPGSNQLLQLDEDETLADQKVEKDDSEVVKEQKRQAKEMSADDQKKAKGLLRRLKDASKSPSNQEGQTGLENLDPKLYEGRFAFDLGTARSLTVGEKFCFTQYLLNHFNDRLTEKPKSALKRAWQKGEIEYLLGGSSKGNINGLYVSSRIFAIREGLNIVHLVKSPDKMKIITEASLLVSSLFPIAQPLTEAGFVGLWAALESAEEMRCLFKGESISLLKTNPDQWLTDFDGNRVGSSSGGSKKPTELEKLEWINYRGYLTLFLSLENDQKLAQRAMVLIDLNLQLTEQAPVPWSDLVVSHRVTVKSQNGEDIQFEASYLSQMEK